MKRSTRYFPLLGSLFIGCLVFSMQSRAEEPANQETEAANLAMKAQNPIANLISVPMKLDWDTGIGPKDADRYATIVQPVIPVSLNKNWNVISRTIVPVFIHAEAPVAGAGSTSGIGDILQSFFFSPVAPTAGGWIWGAGPVMSIPTASKNALGTEKFSLGPTAVMLKQQYGWTYGALVNHMWSVAGKNSRADVSTTLIQPFLAYTTATQTTFSINTESTYDWKAKQWAVPLNVSVSKLTLFGRQPISFQIGYRYWLDTPSGGPDWGLRFTVSLLFPQ